MVPLQGCLPARKIPRVGSPQGSEDALDARRGLLEIRHAHLATNPPIHGVQATSMDSSGATMAGADRLPAPLPPVAPPAADEAIPAPLSIPTSSRRALRSAGSVRPSSRSRARTPHSGRSSNGFGDSIMLQAKQARKRAEEEVKLLMNRLHHLKAQEEKTLKRITETEIRAKEVLELKKRHTAHHCDKVSMGETTSKKVLVGQGSIHKINEERKVKLQSVRQKIVEDKRVKAVSIRHLKKKLADDLVLSRASVEVVRRERTAEIRKQRVERHEKKEAAWAELNERLAEEYARKIADEARAAALAEQMAKRLEDQEAQLIERLRKAQESQRKAYTVLQRSIHLAASQLALEDSSPRVDSPRPQARASMVKKKRVLPRPGSPDGGMQHARQQDPSPASDADATSDPLKRVGNQADGLLTPPGEQQGSGHGGSNEETAGAGEHPRTPEDGSSGDLMGGDRCGSFGPVGGREAEAPPEEAPLPPAQQEVEAHLEV